MTVKQITKGKKINKYNLMRALSVKDVLFAESEELSKKEVTVEKYSGEK